MTYQNINKAAVDTATPLAFGDPPRFAPLERQANITIEAGPLGITVQAEYIGTLASIPAAIERLRTAGVLELVSAAKVAPAAAAPARKPMTGITPAYDGAGQAMCPVHHKALSEGRYGAYCPSRAEGEHANAKGYCNIRFTD